MASALPLLVVDGYNVIHGTPRYASFIDDTQEAAHSNSVSMRVFADDPFDRAREALLTDVAAYAQGRYEPVIVFDAAGNLADERPNPKRGGVQLIFSRTGESGDTVIERLVTGARRSGRSVMLVTSDNTIRYTVGGEPVTVISSGLLAADIAIVAHDVALARDEQRHSRMTLESRLPAEQRERLRRLLR